MEYAPVGATALTLTRTGIQPVEMVPCDAKREHAGPLLRHLGDPQAMPEIPNDGLTEPKEDDQLQRRDVQSYPERRVPSERLEQTPAVAHKRCANTFLQALSQHRAAGSLTLPISNNVRLASLGTNPVHIDGEALQTRARNL